MAIDESCVKSVGPAVQMAPGPCLSLSTAAPQARLHPVQPVVPIGSI